MINDYEITGSINSLLIRINKILFSIYSDSVKGKEASCHWIVFIGSHILASQEVGGLGCVLLVGALLCFYLALLDWQILFLL
jgi:hypothetical protein